jgi:two-component system response regulator ResD
VQLHLEEAGFRVLTAGDGLTGLSLHARELPELVVLDLLLPGMDGWEVCRRIRQVAATPLLMLTARRLESDRVRGLDMGADDYLTKPFSPRELVSRVRAILRRTAGSNAQAPPSVPRDRLTFPGLTIIPPARSVERDGFPPIALTAREFDLLLTLASAPGYVFSREELFTRVLGYEYFGDSRAVDLYIGTLRRKLGEDSAQPRYIKTMWRVGYKFDPGE